MLRRLITLSIIIAIFSTISNASSGERFIINSKYYDWVVFENKNHRDKQCYIASFPVKTNSNKSFKRNSHIKISFFKSDKIQEFSAAIGIKFKLNSPSFLLIGDKRFKLFTDGDYIWLKTKQDDKALIELMLKNAYLKIRSNSAFGSFSIDEYSLKGFNMAYARMRVLCQKEYNI